MLLFMSLSVMMSAHALAHDRLETLVLSNSTLPPVTTADSRGYLDKLYAEWFSRAGLRVRLLAVPAARGLENANAGIYDGDAARTEIDASRYPHLHKVQEPVSRTYLHGFHIDPEISIRHAADFAAYRVGYVRGWQSVERLLDGADKVIALRDANGLMDMLIAGRIDIAILPLAPAREMARVRHLDSLRKTEFRLEQTQYLFLHTRHLDKLFRLREALGAMKFDGSYEAIMAAPFTENR